MAYEAGAIIARIKATASEFKQTVDGVKAQVRDLSESCKRNAEGFRTMGLVAGAAFAAIGFGLKSATDASNQAKAALLGLDSVAKSFGQDAEAAKQSAMSLAEDGLAPMATYATGLKNLMSAGLGLDQASRLIDAFKDRAAFGRNATISFDQAIVNLTQSFKTEQSELGDASGMTENYSKLLERGAQILGKKVTELTNAERAQAKYLAILEASVPYEGNAAQAAQTVAGAQARWAAATLQLRQVIGESFEPVLKDLLRSITPVVKATVEWVKANPELTRSIIVVGAVLTGMVATLGALGLAIPAVTAGIKALGLSFSQFLPGGAIILGLVALVELIRQIGRESALAKRSVAELNDVAEATDKLRIARKHLAEEENRLRAAMSRAGITSEKDLPFLPDSLVAARKEVRALEDRLRDLQDEAKREANRAQQRAAEDNIQTTRTATDVLRDMEKALAAAETKERLLGDTFNLNEEKSRILEAALDDLISLGLKPTDAALQDVFERLQRVNDELTSQAWAADEARSAMDRYLEKWKQVQAEIDKRTKAEQDQLAAQLQQDKLISMDSLLPEVGSSEYEKLAKGLAEGTRDAAARAVELLESDKLISMDSLIDFDSPEVQAGIAAGAKHAAQLAAQEAERVAAEEAARRAESDAAARKAMADGWSKYYADREAAEKALTATITNTAASAVTALLDAGRGVQGFFESLFDSLRTLVARMVANAIAGVEAVKTAVRVMQNAITKNPLFALLGLGAAALFGRGESEAERQAREAAEETKRKWQEVADSIKGALTTAFHAETYTDFLKELRKGIERVVKDGLIKAFLESEKMKPLLKQLVDSIMGGADKGVIQSLVNQIGELSKQFYEQLRGLNLDLSLAAAGGYSGGVVSVAPRVVNNFTVNIPVEAKAWTYDEARKAAREIEAHLRDFASARA